MCRSPIFCACHFKCVKRACGRGSWAPYKTQPSPTPITFGRSAKGYPGARCPLGRFITGKKTAGSWSIISGPSLPKPKNARRSPAKDRSLSFRKSINHKDSSRTFLLVAARNSLWNSASTVTAWPAMERDGTGSILIHPRPISVIWLANR